MAKRLTEAAVRNQKPGPSRREIPDGGKTGLYLVVQPTGVKSWAVRYRLNGHPVKLTLGKYPKIGLAEAHKRAEQALLKVERGEDPSAERRRAHSAPAADSVAAVVDVFIERYAKPKNRSWQATCQFASNRDPLFASNSDPSGCAGLGLSA